jgi:hypothetical protein
LKFIWIEKVGMFHAEEKRKAKGDLLRTPLWERRNKPVRKEACTYLKNYKE